MAQPQLFPDGAQVDKKGIQELSLEEETEAQGIRLIFTLSSLR